jgi:hypothetical protein
MLVASAAAQAQDAFYVYQNDGHFDGFFYDEVEKIRYSKLDTLGFEHEVYVSQEIVTADSTYRFMLTAIDSIGFVQPTIEFRPNVHDVRKDGLLGYMRYHNQEAMQMALYTSIPEQLIPNVGDVLIDFDVYQGFSGRVTRVEPGSTQIFVYYEPIESVKDVFQRFVCVERIDRNKAGNMVRRRVAGAPELTKGDWSAKTRASDVFDFQLLKMDLNGHLPLVAEEDLTISLDFNTHVAMSLKGSYNINLLDPIYISLTFTSDLAFGMGVTFDGKLSTIIDSSSDYIPGIPIPTAAPIFELRNIPGFFARGDVHFKLSAGLVNLAGAKVWHKLEFNDDWIPSLTYGRLNGEAEAEQPGATTIDDYLEFNGFVQAGVHAPLTLSTNRWLSKFFEAEFGTHLYIGPKLSGAVQLNFTDMMKNGASVYNALKNTALTFAPLSVDFETTAKTKGFFGGESKFTFGEGSVSVIDDCSLYLLPQFDSWEEEMDPRDSEGNMKVGPYFGLVCKDCATLFPYQIGIRIFKKTNDNKYELNGDIWEADRNGWGESWYYGDKWLKSKNLLDHPHIAAWQAGFNGEGRLRPIFKYGDMIFEGSPDYDGWIGDYFRIKPTTIEISDKVGDEACLNVETNMKLKDMSDMTFHYGGYADKGNEKFYYADVDFRVRYQKLSESKGELYFTNVKTNMDPFRQITMECSTLYPNDADVHNIDITPPLTIVQAPNTDAKFYDLSINGKGEFPDANFYCRYYVPSQPVSINDGAFSVTYTDTYNYGWTTKTITISGTLSPDEKGWGYFNISGNYEMDVLQNTTYEDEKEITHTGPYFKMKTNASFSGHLALKDGMWRLLNDGDCFVNGTSTTTKYDRKIVSHDGVKELKTTTTTNTYTCSEGDSMEMTLVTKENE